MVTTGLSVIDRHAGGLAERAAYLVYGPSGLGKSTFALSFLQQGAVRGETVALVTSRVTEVVLSQAMQAGIELNEHVRSGRLIILEYPPGVEELARTQMDDSAVVDEFLDLAGAQSVSRWVFDPLTPLLSRLDISFATNRFRAITNALTSTGATSLLLMDLPDSEPFVNACRDYCDGVLRFDYGPYATGPKRLSLERLPGRGAGNGPIPYEIMPGIGLVAATGEFTDGAASGSLTPPRLPVTAVSTLPMVAGRERETAVRILVAHPPGSQLDLLRGLLSSQYSMYEAAGVAECLARVASEDPQLLILAMATRGVPGTEIVRKLRQNGRNLPIIMIGDQFQRRSDQISALETGVDVCLQSPLDGRILLLNVHNLLCRSGGRNKLSLEAPRMMPPPRRDPISSTSDLTYFLDRVKHELHYANHFSLALPLFSLRAASGFGDLDEISAVAATLCRSHDLIYVGAHGVVVCLAEAEDWEPFLARFRKHWKHQVTPIFESPRFDESKDPIECIREFLLSHAGEVSLEPVNRG